MPVRLAATALFLALFAVPAAAAPGDTLCTLAQEAGAAISACSAVIAEQPLRDSARAAAYAKRGWAYADSHNATAARSDFETALALDADNVTALLGRAVLEGNGGQGDAALADFAKVERLEPNNEGLHIDRAQYFISQKRYADAIADADFRRYRTGFSLSFLNLRCRARAYGGIELDAGRKACDEAIWAGVTAPAVIEARGIIALKQKRYDAALTDFTRLSTEQPQAARSWYGKALAENALGAHQTAEGDFARARRINRDIDALYAGLGLPGQNI